MKTFLPLCGLFAAGLCGQTRIAPDCVITFTFTAATAATPANTCGQNTQGIVDWTLVYSNYNFSALSIVVQSAPDAGGTPGSWGTFSGTVNVGSNPSTSTTSAYVRLTGFNPWNRVYLSSVTGTGSITGVLYGCRQPGCSQSSAGGGSSGLPIQVNGSAIGTASTLNFAAGTNITQTGGDSAGIVTVTTNASGSSTTPVVVVQGCANANSGTPSSIGCVFPANLTAGNTLEVCVMDVGNSLSGVAWSGDSGTFTTDLSNENEAVLYMDCAHVVGLAGGGATITATVSLSNAFIVGLELHGVTTGLDQSDAGLGGFTQYVVGNAVTTTHSNEIAIGCLFMGAGIWGTGFSNFQGRAFVAGAPPSAGLEVQMLPGPQTLFAIGLQASSNYEISHIVTFY